jgi:hypothetical protein
MYPFTVLACRNPTPNLSRVFFANSGAEANDAAIKLAWKVTGRPEIISIYMSKLPWAYDQHSLGYRSAQE